jgi:sodium pump decarboxylase gamma subunit
MDGVVFMVIGMVTVCIFLCVLVAAVEIMRICLAKLAKRFPEQEIAAAVPSDGINEVAGAIAAAYSIKKGYRK